MPYTAASDMFRGKTFNDMATPPHQLVSITPNDGADLALYVRGLTCTTAGAVSIVPMEQTNETAVVVGLTPGVWLDVCVRKVNATGTTAVGIVGALL